MPKLKLQVSEHQIAMLRHKVESQLGRPLRDISDARILSEALATSIGQSLSVSTIYRTLINKSNKTQPYRNTLTILAAYCGYPSWDVFVEAYHHTVPTQLTDDSTTRDLIQINLALGHTDALRAYLAQFDHTTPAKVRYQLGYSLYTGMKPLDESLTKTIFQELTPIYAFRRLFFEMYADPDFTIAGYEFGLRQFLLGVQPYRSLDDLREYLFATVLLYRHYHRTESDDMQTIGNELYESLLLPEKIDRDPTFHWPYNRYCAYRLWHIEYNGSAVAAHAYFRNQMEKIKHSISLWDYEERKIVLHIWNDTIVHAHTLTPLHQQELFHQFRDFIQLPNDSEPGTFVNLDYLNPNLSHTVNRIYPSS